MYYYKYNFISPESIYANVKEELKSYFDSGAVDDLMFPTWTDKCLRKLGKSSYNILPWILHLDNFEARLPDGFIAVREAWMCTQVHGKPYREASSFYSQAHSLDTIKVSPETSNEDCTGDCLPNTIQVVYKTNNEFNQTFTKQYLLKPGNISVRNSCSFDCANFGSSSPDTFDIHNNKFVTNFRCGTVYLLYYGADTDASGNQMIPDDYRVKEYIEAFIKYKVFEMLSNQLVDETYKQIQEKMLYYKQQSEEAYILAESSIKKQDVYSKVRAIKRQRNSFNLYKLPGDQHGGWWKY